MAPAPFEPDDEDYPVAREPGPGEDNAPEAYPSSTDAPHEVDDAGYPEADTPDLE